jgi:hypothetical protein
LRLEKRLTSHHTKLQELFDHPKDESTSIFYFTPNEYIKNPIGPNRSPIPQPSKAQEVDQKFTPKPTHIKKSKKSKKPNPQLISQTPNALFSLPENSRTKSPKPRTIQTSYHEFLRNIDQEYGTGSVSYKKTH